ncbi:MULTISPECIES: hypothetical protein [Parachlamydia]|jgi:hypothetical protein|uniref:Uncharacterized protein n=2 Tax=Parachlamydia acanthamoebae TaxID=83552 RepID=F8KYJ5_PARAV|nr:hypothetical protein [Parachlamydia acanthamoebae]EFB42369.1 hypothetical protein pah_c010o072 [Parachlamydia acanthamoebae str. Hall's coccus]KIA78354.1 hypothetical protein DB43_EF00360 [Parachlamydia acanthamoebae]CCB85949.1 putative uncharacterized protein [Parachlamydia acanthamoebae UV-7]
MTALQPVLEGHYTHHYVEEKGNMKCGIASVTLLLAGGLTSLHVGIQSDNDDFISAGIMIIGLGILSLVACTAYVYSKIPRAEPINMKINGPHQTVSAVYSKFANQV